ncbi:MAG: HD domain-containing phosphohydrolase [Candidatus Eisenbacteria bacterium]
MDPMHPILLTVRALTEVMDGADPHTRGRSQRIAQFTVNIACELGASEAQRVELELGALLHDLGRNAILNDVVRTPRVLDASEFAVVQTHPTIGWELLKDIPGLLSVAEIVYAHHERPDGKGYPRQLSADAVPLGARIIMVCAAYDAMTEERPYRHGLSPAQACEELQRHRGTQFFPEIVDAFVKLHESGRLWDGLKADEPLPAKEPRVA